MTRKQSEHKTFDVFLFSVVTFLAVFGTVMVYSGSVPVALQQNLSPQHYFIRQIIWVLLGFASGFIAFKINYRILQKFSRYILAVAIILLVLVLVLNAGEPIKRWIDLGAFDLQPSEIAKLAFLIYLSDWLTKQRDNLKVSAGKFAEHFLNDLLPFLILLMVVTILIVIEPDLDTAIMLGTTSFLVYYISGKDYLHLLGSISIAGLLSAMVAITTQLANYRIERVSVWYDFWVKGQISDPYGSGYQLQQILVAVASGGLFGVGFGESRQKFLYLGETAFSDTIFAIFAEEFGLLGSIILIVMFLFFLYRGMKIATQAVDKFGFLLATSITIWITLQAFLHIASNVALIPINGNTLPFISYGGSSTVINLTAVGLLLNVSRREYRIRNSSQGKFPSFNIFSRNKRRKLKQGSRRRKSSGFSINRLSSR